MFANLKFVIERFDRYNTEIFNNALPKVALRIGSSRRMLGSLRFKKRSMMGCVRCFDFTITISNRLDLPEAVIEDTIIHEMIHLYIHHNGIKDSSAHGEKFRGMMHEINRNHSRHITITHRSTEEESSSDQACRWHYILFSRFNTGDEYLTLCAQTKIFEFNRLISRVPGVRTWEWYVSTDPCFNVFPRSRTLKFYNIPEKVRYSMLSAVKCRCENGRFYPE